MKSKQPGIVKKLQFQKKAPPGELPISVSLVFVYHQCLIHIFRYYLDLSAFELRLVVNKNNLTSFSLSRYIHCKAGKREPRWKAWNKCCWKELTCCVCPKWWGIKKIKEERRRRKLYRRKKEKNESDFIQRGTSTKNSSSSYFFYHPRHEIL